MTLQYVLMVVCLNKLFLLSFRIIAHFLINWDLISGLKLINVSFLNFSVVCKRHTNHYGLGLIYFLCPWNSIRTASDMGVAPC